MPLRAGEALVFDNRVVHFSMPNRSDRPRVVASFGMRPAEGHCILLRDDGAGAVDLFHVDDDFYIDVLPATQHEWVPPTPPVAKVALVREGWSPDELLAARHAAGDPPRGIVSDPGSLVWSDPGRFCALCGSDDVDVDDRGARNNAQLVCRSFAAGLAG